MPQANEQGVQRRMVLVVIIFQILEMIIFCFVVALFFLVHDVGTIFHLPANSIWKSFMKYE